MTSTVARIALRAMVPATAEGPLIGDYDSELRTKDGEHVDCELMIKRLQDLGANTYMWLIWHNANDWDDLHEFLPLAKEAGITVWVYLVPHSETPFQDPQWPYSEPFKLDYVRWAQEIAKLSLEHENLIGWVIDDFWGNFSPARFSIDYTREMIEAGRAINPKLKFYPLMYYMQFGRRFAENLAPLIDGCVAAYPRNREEIQNALRYLNDDYAVPEGMGFIHPWDTPSSAGDHACIAQEATVEAAERHSLTVAYSDDFDGPTEGYHVLQVRVNETVVWQEDAAGEDDGEVTIDLTEAIGEAERVTVRLGVWDLQGVGNFGLLAGMTIEQVEGLQMVTDVSDEEAWEESKRGNFALEGAARAEGTGRFKLPLIIMTAGQRVEFAQRNEVDALTERIAAKVQMALEFVADGRAEGVVTYCLDKTPGNPDLDAVAEVYGQFRAEHMQDE